MFRRQQIAFLSLAFILFLFLAQTEPLLACSFDEIQLPIHEIRYENDSLQPSLKYKIKRDHGKKHEPLRIHVHYGDLLNLNASEVEPLKKVIQSSLNRVSSLLSVEPIQKNLLLKRNQACSRYMNSGLAGNDYSKRCASIKKGYKHEYCKSKVDSFIIPDEHLLGVDVYDKDGVLISAASLPGGQGIPNSDFILYVTSRTTDYCQEKNIIAYSSICQLNELDKPLAGFVNFCPLHLKPSQYSLKKLELTIIHELLHTLGFSSELFPKFRECDDSGYCFQRKSTITDGGINLMMLPSVIDQMQLHFRCSDPDFGAPLETLENNKVGSHWDALILHNSIMAPNLNELELTAIDSITAAVFENTGWYKVNYSATDPYLWGKDSGCNLARIKQCDYEYTCKLSDTLNTGCDVSQTSISHCKAIPNQPCGFYEYNDKKCVSSNENSQACFVITDTNNTQGYCLNYRCSGENLHLEYKNQWLPCPSGSQIDTEFLPELRMIRCPDANQLCQLNIPLLDEINYLALQGNESSIHQLGSKHYKLWIKFSSPTPSSMKATPFENDLDFRDEAVKRVSETASIPISWVHDIELIVRGSYYWLYVCFSPPQNNTADQNETEIIIARLEELVKKGNLTMDLHSPEIRPVRPKLSTAPIKGLTALWIVGCVILVSIIIAGILTTIFQQYSKHRLAIV